MALLLSSRIGINITSYLFERQKLIIYIQNREDLSVMPHLPEGNSCSLDVSNLC